MILRRILSTLDEQIDRLEQARALLAGISTSTSTVKRGRRTSSAGATPTPKKQRKGNMSAEGRARIAAAQRKRWAAQK